VRTIHIPSLLAIAVVSLVVVAHADGGTTKEQNETRKVAQNARQHSIKPIQRSKQQSRGRLDRRLLAVLAAKIVVAGSGKGEGIAVKNKSRSGTFMKRIEFQAGLGFGVK
jgi:hypothetical protein